MMLSCVLGMLQDPPCLRALLHPQLLQNLRRFTPRHSFPSVFLRLLTVGSHSQCGALTIAALATLGIDQPPLAEP